MKKTFLFKTSLSLLTGAFLLCIGCNPAQDEGADTGSNQLLQHYDVLHQRLKQLLAEDSSYAGLLQKAASPAVLDAQSGRIMQAEMALQKTADSLQQTTPEENSAETTRITSYFKALLQSRRVFSDMRMALSAGSDDSVMASQTVLQLRYKLNEKERQLAALERQQDTRGSTPARPAEGPATLRQQNEALQQQLRQLQTKYFNVGRNYLVLQKEHERTLNEVASLRKKATSN